jgi:hypothetical protein
MTDYWCYKYMDFPPIPDRFIQEALAIAHDEQASDVSHANDTAWLPKPNRTIYVDGKPTKSRRTPRWDLSADFSDWVRQNICEDFIDAAVSISQGDPDATTTGVHTDGVRHYTMIYLIEKSNDGQKTMWWQEQGHPVQRTERSYYLESWDTVTKLAEVEYPMFTWICMNVGILHSIHNIQGYRIAIHVSLPYDPFTNPDFFKKPDAVMA